MKNERHEALLALIRERAISTQEELTNSLIKQGFAVTQSTVSRDIKELRIVKSLDPDGRYRYVSAPDPVSLGESDDKYIEIFTSSVVSVRSSMNDVVIRCYSGMASSACVAVDKLFCDMIVGSLAGDDTIFIITDGEKTARELSERILKLISPR